MKTEEWEDLFREQVNGLDSAPPQTGWNGARSWNKLEKQLASPVKPAGRRIAWWTYAAAVALLVPALLLSLYFQGQQEEIAQLKVALKKVKAAEADSIRRSTLSGAVARDQEPDYLPSIAGPAQTHTAHTKALSSRKVENPDLPNPADRKVEPVVASLEKEVPIVENRPDLVDSISKRFTDVPGTSAAITYIHQAAKKTAGRKVMIVFSGEQTPDPAPAVRLVESPVKPAKKFIFLSGEKENSSTVQPEDASSPFAFTVKPRKSFH